MRIKFQCLSVEHFRHSRAAKFTVVYSNEGEDMDFAKSTPNGNMMIQLHESSSAMDFFIPGDKYYLDISKAEK